MKFCSVALCLSVSAKVVAGASINIDEVHQFKQTIAKFQDTVEEAVGKGDREQLEKILSSSETTTAERVWYCSKYRKTIWDINCGSIRLAESEDNIPSITIADNPESLRLKTLYVCDKVQDPTNLAIYDAVNILMTLPYLSEFDAIDLQHLGAVKIIELLNRRKEHGFDPAVIKKAKDTKTLQNYIDKQIWKPTGRMVTVMAKAKDTKTLYDYTDKQVEKPTGRMIVVKPRAIADDAEALQNPTDKQVEKPTGEMVKDKSDIDVESLLFLQRTAEGTPSPHDFNTWIKEGNESALDRFRLYCPEWKPSHCDIDEAIINGYKDVLEFYLAVDPNMPLPGALATHEAIKRGHTQAVQWNIELVKKRDRDIQY